ncbi:hypothetical protein PF006_g11043 [Phytophthora fragariae]|uniref:Tyrosine-protein kinase ephrin type A/B receptor-like domain-containing protein n=1 Tax=Phytophthora fragariae TaxID=53985 RepID=A0A6A3TXQ1_9STRA|nr:hypothetical protein PF006_g11043 [Phytophthora fragariae]
MRLLVIIALWVVQVCASDGIMDMLASFIDLEGLAEQAASEGGAATKPVDTTYPLASEEMNALMQMYRDCRTLQSAAMRTWCTGSDVDSVEAERDNAASCPQGVLTHPCSGRVLHANRSASEDEIEFLWPWEGLRCDAFTDPTTVTHIYLPSEGLKCELAELDLSVMVSLEQLDLSGNQLHGAFPAWLGEMTLLRLLNLQGNRLSGDIPPSFAGNDALELVNLSGNNLTASSLGFFDAFHRLQHLDLSTNKIVLEVAKGVVASEFLRTINLSHNALYGNLPELPRFQYLVSFDLSSNFFTGELPQHLSLWGREDPHDPDENSVLTILNVSNNLFTGDLPTILNQSSLRQFDVHNNNFSGFLPQFPPSLLEHVKPADFGGNDFLCPIPPALLPSSLTCICGNGYTTKSSRVTAANSSGDSRQDPMPANEAAEFCVPCPEGSFLTGGVECIFAKPGEVYERVEWPRVLLELAVTGKREIVDESLEIVFQTWRDTLTSHTASSYQLHVLQVVQSITSTTSTHILVAVETITPTKVSADKKIPGKVENAVKDAENALDDLLDELNASIYGNESHNSEEGQILDLITSRSFQNSLVRQLDHLNLFDGALTSDMVNLTVLDPAFTSTRAVACTPGTFFTLTEDSNQTDRECRPCVPGSFSASSGSLKCEPCPRGTFSALEGQAKCESCPVGSDSAPGALSCVSCSWFTYACNGFWTDLVVAVCVVAALLRTICKKARKWSAGDPEERELDESVALMAAVRTHGRTLDQVQYEPMGEVSAETMFGHGTLNM